MGRKPQASSNCHRHMIVNLSMKYLFTIVLFLSLSACSTLPLDSNWPDTIPQRSYFIDYYNQDRKHRQVVNQDEYLKWIHRFYFGWELYRRGWLQATDELVATINDSQQKAIAKEKSLLIGKLVAPEWAKNRAYRVINTKHIAIWGNAISESIVRGEQLAILDKILDDVTDLLARNIQPKEISKSRYYLLENFGDDFE
ncbi:MAG: hypothetical protein AAF195_04020 [Pseudomonadota bacterium]